MTLETVSYSCHYKQNKNVRNAIQIDRQYECRMCQNKQ